MTTNSQDNGRRTGKPSQPTQPTSKKSTIVKKIIALIGSLIAALHFMAGAWTVPDETLNYSVHYRWGFINANAGIVTLSTVNNPAENTFKATMTGKSVNLLGHYYAASDTLTGTIMSDRIKPVYTERISDENGEFEIETITYDTDALSSDGEVIKRLPNGEVVRSRISHYGGGMTLDLLCVFYYMRQINYGKLDEGATERINVFSGKTPETLDIKYWGKDTLKDDPDNRETYHITLDFSSHNGENTTSIEAWISTDEQRIPLLVRGGMKIGRFVCRYMPEG